MVMVMVVEAEHGGDGHRHRHEGTVEFENLPEDCIANVISFTTPRDACTLSLVSSTFRSAARSDVVWERFLPSDYKTIISQSSSLASPTSLSFASKKDLYQHLCQKYLLIDSGKKSFALDKLHGKKCYMLSARILSIVWGDTPRYWKWTSVPHSRFPEVAELVSVCWFEIKGWIKTCTLSPETLYGAYLVYKQSTAGAYGFEYQPVEVTTAIVGEGDTRRRTVYLDAPRPRRPRYQIAPRRAGIFNRTRSRLLASLEAPAPARARAPAPAPAPVRPPAAQPSVPIDPTRVELEYPRERGDGWWEIELGDFFNREGEEEEVEMGVYEVKSGDWKGGLVFQGIEIRPK